MGLTVRGLRMKTALKLCSLRARCGRVRVATEQTTMGAQAACMRLDEVPAHHAQTSLAAER